MERAGGRDRDREAAEGEREGDRGRGGDADEEQGGAGAASGGEVAEHAAGQVGGSGFGTDEYRGERAEVVPHQRGAVGQGLGPGEVAVMPGLDKGEVHDRQAGRQQRRGHHRGPVAAELEEVGGDHLAGDDLVHELPPTREVRPRKRSASDVRTGAKPDTLRPAWTRRVVTAPTAPGSARVTRRPPGAWLAWTTAGCPASRSSAARGWSVVSS